MDYVVPVDLDDARTDRHTVDLLAVQFSMARFVDLLILGLVLKKSLTIYDC